MADAHFLRKFFRAFCIFYSGRGKMWVMGVSDLAVATAARATGVSDPAAAGGSAAAAAGRRVCGGGGGSCMYQ